MAAFFSGREENRMKKKAVRAITGLLCAAMVFSNMAGMRVYAMEDHIHVLLTMRPITENGEWGAKQKKIYDLDENGEKIPVIDKMILSTNIDNITVSRQCGEIHHDKEDRQL